MYELPLREWVIIFYPQTGATRLCPTLDFARNFVTSEVTVKRHVYRSPNDFRTRHDHIFLEGCWKVAHENATWSLPRTAIGRLEDYNKVPPDTDTETFVKLLWEFLQDVGDRLHTPRMESTKTKENYELKLGDMNDLASDKEKFKEQYNNQARIVFTALLENGKQFLNEEEIKKIILTLVAKRALKTRQEPWVIFQYYRPQFIKDGFIVRGRAPKKTRTE